MPFLTELDPRAAVTSSRDPLGLQPIWLTLGRRTVVNFTTVTTSVRNFTTLLLGLYYADEAIRRGVISETQRVSAFLSFEQLAAYTRFARSGSGNENDEAPRGLRRVKRRNEDGNGKVTISASPEHQILSNQQTYGIWGLYTVAARNSGLVEQGQNELTDLARRFVESDYLSVLSTGAGREGGEIIRYFGTTRSFEPERSALADVLWSVLRPQYRAPERRFYHETLVLGAHSQQPEVSARQAELWDVLVELNRDGDFRWRDQFDYRELTAARKMARRRRLDLLEAILLDIEVAEPILVACAALFGFLLDRNGMAIDTVAAEVASTWKRGLTHLEIDQLKDIKRRLFSDSTALPDSLIAIAAALQVGDYGLAIRTALDHNEAIMSARGGAPWVSLEDGRFRVRLREEPKGLPDPIDMRTAWSNSYLLNSLKAVGGTLNPGAAA